MGLLNEWPICERNERVDYKRVQNSNLHDSIHQDVHMISLSNKNEVITTYLKDFSMIFKWNLACSLQMYISEM